MNEEPLKEELTTAMHAEFRVTRATDRKHRAWVALEALHNGMKLDDALYAYGVTMGDLKRYNPEFEKLTAIKVVLEYFPG